MKKNQQPGQQGKLAFVFEFSYPDTSMLQPNFKKTIPAAKKKPARAKSKSSSKVKLTVTRTSYKKKEVRSRKG